MSPRPLLIAALLFSAVAACSRRAIPPPRPQGVPEAAVWAGGVDGGSFIVCEFDSVFRLNRCSVYNDVTGRLEVEGHFEISGTSKAENVSSFRYSAVDGRRIYLKDGSILTRRDPGAAAPL